MEQNNQTNTTDTETSSSISNEPGVLYPNTQQDPGKPLAIAGLLLSFVPFIGMFLSIASIGSSRSAGYSGKLGVIGIIVQILAIILFFAAIGAADSSSGSIFG